MTLRFVIFSDDWGRHPSSCQYIVRELLADSKVLWVNTIGMRSPRFDAVTARRGAEKLVGWLAKSLVRTDRVAESTSLENLEVLDAKMWPWMTRRMDRRINQALLARQLRNKVVGGIAVTTIPIVADIVGEIKVDKWIYYCVDDFSAWPGLNQSAILDMERELVEKTDGIIAVSDVLQARMQGWGKGAELLTHGVDVDRWSRADIEPYQWQEQIRKPVVLFWGVIDQRLDAEFVLALADQCPELSIVLVGPVQNPDPRILNSSKVHLLPPVGLDDLPRMATNAACLMMPYIDADVTRAMQPLKLKEYLATGRPVVARRLPSTEPWSEGCLLVSDASDFVTSVRVAVKGTNSQQNPQIRERLATESWKSKAARFRRMVEGIASAPLLDTMN